MSDTLLKLIIIAGVALLLLFGYRSCEANRDKVAAQDQFITGEQRTNEATGGILDDINQDTQDTQRVEVIVHEIRTEYQREYQAARDADPDVAEWGDGVIPQRMRDLARQRREERERLGRPGDGRGDDGEAEGARR